MPIPAPDLALLRGTYQVIRPTVNVFPPVLVASAVVATTPLTYPIGEIAVQTTVNWSDVQIGQMVKISTEDGELVTYGVVRKAALPGTLYIDGKSRGDPGQATNIAYGITAGQIVEIYSLQPLWALLSRILSGAFYKKYDIPYDGSGSNPNPVCNLGDWQVIKAVGGLGRVSINNDDSFAWNNKVITTYLWEIPDDATIISGSLSSPSIVFDAPPGFYIVRCTITDNGNASQTSMRPVWINDPVLYPALSDQYTVQIESDRQDYKGRNMTLRVTGDVPESLIMPGTAFVYSEISTFDGEELSPGILVDNYVGFISAETPKYDRFGGQKSVAFDVKSPYERMGEIPMVSQAIIEKANPTNWTQIKTGLGDPNFIGWYILKHHTSFLDMFDYSKLPESDPPRKKNWGLNGSTVSEYLEQVGKMIAGNIGCISNGALYLRRNPNIEDATFRNNLDVRLTWTPDDVTDPPEFAIAFFAKVGQLKAFALTYDGDEASPYGSIAPGYVQGQAPGRQDEESLIIRSSQGQTGLNAIAGHLLAKANNPKPEIQLKISRNMDVVEPAKMLWCRFDFPASYAPRGEALTGRVLPKSVDRSWVDTGGTWIKNITIGFDTETSGQPGEKYVIAVGQAGVYPPEQPPEDNTTGLLEEIGGLIVAWNSEGDIGRSFDGLSYQDIRGGIVGTVCDAHPDWFSAYVRSGYSEGALGAWLVSAYDDELNIYYGDNLLGDTVTWTLAAVFIMADNTVTTSARIVASKTEDGYVIAAWCDQTGTNVVRSVDSGLNWDDPILIGDSGNLDTAHDNYEIGLSVDGTDVVVSGREAGADKFYFVYLSEGTNDPFVQVDNSPVDGDGRYASVPISMLAQTEEGELYANRVAVDVDLSPSTFATGSAALSLDVLTNYPDLPTNSYFITDPNRFQFQRDVVTPVQAGTARAVDNPGPYTYQVDLTGTTPVSGIASTGLAGVQDAACTATPIGETPNYLTLSGLFMRTQYSIGANCDDIASPFYIAGSAYGVAQQWILAQRVKFLPANPARTYNVANIEWTVVTSVGLPPLAWPGPIIPTDQWGSDNAPAVLRIEMETYLILTDTGGEAIWTSPIYRFFTNEMPVSFSLGSPLGNRADLIKTSTFSFPFPTDYIQDVGGIFVMLRTRDEVIPPNPYQSTFAPSAPTSGGFEFGVTNITMVPEQETSTYRYFYQVEAYRSAAAEWDDLTEDVDSNVPDHPYAVNVSGQLAQYVSVVGSDESDLRTIYLSTDEAGIFTEGDSDVPYVGIRRSGNVFLLFGEDAIDLDKTGIDPVSLIGDWENSIGTVGTIRGVIAIV